MPIFLKQSTASQEIPLGYFVDSNDGDAEEVGLTINNTDIKLWKAGATTLANKNSGGATHISNGIYYCTLDATDTNTLGSMIIFCHVSGALTVRVECCVLAANVYDSLIAASDYLQADVIQVEGSDATDQITASVPTAAAIRTEIDSNSTQLAAIVADTDELQTDDVPGLIAALNDPTAAAIADAVWDEASTGHVDAGKAGAQLWTDVDAILADTNELQTDDVPGLIAALNDPTAGAIADQVWEEAIADHSGTSGSTAEALSNATAPTAAAVADAVWDEALAAHDTEDTVGNVLNDLVEESGGTYRFTSGALAQAPSGSGAGAITFTYTLTSSVDASPIADADVWVTSDQAGTNVLASGTTNSSGQVTFYLDAGTVYVWRQKSGWNFTNPDTETVA